MTRRLIAPLTGLAIIAIFALSLAWAFMFELAALILRAVSGDHAKIARRVAWEDCE
jgi:hypothetical protein